MFGLNSVRNLDAKMQIKFGFFDRKTVTCRLRTLILRLFGIRQFF